MATLKLLQPLSRLGKIEKRTQTVTTDDGHQVTDVVIRQSTLKLRCTVMLPIDVSRLFDRPDIFVQLDELLTPDTGEFSLQPVALRGLGGVGKAPSHHLTRRSSSLGMLMISSYGYIERKMPFCDKASPRLLCD
ncbi:hypothetical protein B0O99DRAFT_691287 [Bisporella sp. PMI_857]|nr:hypothetical protein B0O99DRAFT_691287 [Bisporella sp. PMI_857]